MSLKLSSIELGTLRLFSLIEKTRVTRYIYVWVAIVMIVKFSLWAAHFAETSPRPGADIALILGAIGGPITGYTVFAFKHYNDSSRTGG